MGICRCFENKPCSVHFFRRHANPQSYEDEKKKFEKKPRKYKKKEDKLVDKLKPCDCSNCDCDDHGDCECDDCECVVCEC